MPDSPLLWQSGTAHPVNFFRASTPEDLDHWQAEDTNGLPLLPIGLIEVQLANYAASDAGSRLAPGRLLILQHLFASLPNPQAVFCHPTRIDGCYRLLLVAQLEGIWVGLQTYYTDPSQC